MSILSCLDVCDTVKLGTGKSHGTPSDGHCGRCHHPGRCAPETSFRALTMTRRL